VSNRRSNSCAPVPRGACAPLGRRLRNARGVWNAFTDKRAALFARCTNEADVIRPSSLPSQLSWRRTPLPIR
jgi:hypothetical protein